jgi:hypothetical protein
MKISEITLAGWRKRDIRGPRKPRRKQLDFNNKITEGGNIFGAATDRIRREHIAPTLQKYFIELKKVFPKAPINPNDFHPVGSVGKKDTSGDIDLAIDGTKLFPNGVTSDSVQAWNINPEEFVMRFDQLQKRAKTSTKEQIAMKAVLQLISEYVNAHAPSIHMDEKKANPGNAFGMFPQYDEQGNNLGIGIQIDWMIGHLPWLLFSYKSIEYGKEDNVKGLHRTQLLLSMLQVKGFSFNHVKGVTDKKTNQVVANTPEEVLKLINSLYGSHLTADELDSYYELIDVAKADSNFDDIMSVYLRILDKTRADIPYNLQEYWIEHQDHFGLTGKFLPDTSNLTKYRKT